MEGGEAKDPDVRQEAPLLRKKAQQYSCNIKPITKTLMKLDIYVNYPGHCEEAFRFYEQHLKGKITEIARHGDQPNLNIPADWKHAVLHARIEIGDAVLMGADIPNAEPMRSAYLTLRLDTADEAENIYDVLTDGGQIFMKMAETPFASRFAMLRDKFGTSWMLLHERDRR